MNLPEDKRPELLQAIYAGPTGKITAIKICREATGCGLKEAKGFVERYAAELYAEHPERFAAPPGKSGCAVAAVVFAALALATALSALAWFK
jgi:hypothetical protein